MIEFPNIHCYESAVDMPLTSLPIRSVLVETNDARVLISPLPKIKDVAAEIQAIGPVTDIVAPNLFHHLGLRPAQEAFPEATIWSVPGLSEKRPNMTFDKELGKDNWTVPELVPIAIEGMPKFNEYVFIHKPTRTLICQDLVFHHLHAKGFGAWLLFKVFGTYKKFGVSRLFKMMTDDKKAMEKSVNTIFEYDFDNLMMAHGEIVRGGAKDKLRAALMQRGIEIS